MTLTMAKLHEKIASTSTNGVSYSTHGGTTTQSRHLHHLDEIIGGDIDHVDPGEAEASKFLDEMMKDSHFFKAHPPRLLPIFDPKEVIVGTLLGEGEFGTVREIENLSTGEENVSLRRFLRRHSSLANANGSNDVVTFEVEGDLSEFDPDCSEATDIVGDLVDDRALGAANDNHNTSFSSLTKEQYSFARRAIHARCFRNGKARYAVKRLKEGIESPDAFCGTLDLAAEATFLAALTHPNIIKIRATVGNPGDPEFMMVLDRLYMTVEERMEEWKIEEGVSPSVPKKRRFPVPAIPSFFRRKNNGVASVSDSLVNRVVVGYDVARALRYLHLNKIIYRDLKPANVGFDIRGDVRLFDFGMARELNDSDLVQLPDDYNCTGLTGSRRWMAPEVVRCEPYGTSCDVYSWGLFFWLLCSLQVPFGSISADWHFRNVVEKNVRPKELKYLPTAIQNLIRDSWSPDRTKRPSMDRICRFLQGQLMVLRKQAVSDSGKYRHRSMFLRQKSKLSLRTLLSESDPGDSGRSRTL